MARAILLAEDSPDDEHLFKRVLKKAGVENPVSVVRDGAEAIKALQGKDLPGILVLDLKMPGVDGFAVLDWLAMNDAIKNQLLIVVLTNLGDAKQIRRAYDLGATSFLAKPFTADDLQNLMKHFNGRWKRATETR